MIEIRSMLPEDFAPFWPTFHAVVTAGETYAYAPDLTEAQAQALWLDLPMYTWVAEEDGILLGSYYLKPNAAGPGSHVCNCGYMVTEAARRRGVAQAMCEHSQRVALDNGFLAMQFNAVVATNEVAVGLWQKLGFEVVGRLPKAFRHRRLGLVDCLVMYKWLAPSPSADEPDTSPLLIGRRNIENLVSSQRRR
jgi:RimJ/RimL family protein N-acetyltransferase